MGQEHLQVLGRGDELAGSTESKLRKKKDQKYQVTGEQSKAARKM